MPENKNSIAQAFDDFGIGDHREDWYCADHLRAYHPELYEKIQQSNCEEIAERLIVELMEQVSSRDSEHTQRVLDWLGSLRELRNAPELQSPSERPLMNRGEVTEGIAPKLA